jgi:transcriptional regulator with XRE-family HTH domain
MEAESSEQAPTNEEEVSYAVKVGAMLRAARRQRRLSLQAVEARSGHEFKASVLGAYERGERTISVPRLVRLARVYGVPATQLVPDDEPERDRSGAAAVALGNDEPANNLTIDLSVLESVIGPERDLLGRFLDLLQQHSGEELTVSVPVSDLRALVALLELVADTVRVRFSRLGVVTRH